MVSFIAMISFLKKYLPILGRFEKKKEFSHLPISSIEDLLQSIISFFQSRVGIRNFPSDILTIIKDYDFAVKNKTLNDLAEVLRIIPKKFNLQMTLHDLSLAEIRAYVTKSSPLLVITTIDRDEISDVYAIEGFNGISYSIVNIATNEKFNLSESKFLIALKIKNDTQKLKILSAEPTIRFLNPNDKEKKKKKDKFFGAIEQIVHLVKLERKDIWIITVYGIGIGILSLVIPISTSSLVNVVTFGVMLQPVYVLTFIVVCFMGFAGLMQVVQTYVIEILQRRIFVRIAIEFSQKFPEMANNSLTYNHKPELANRFFDTITIQKSINSLLVDGLSVVLTAIIGFTLIATYHPLFLVFDIFVLFIGAYLIIYRRGVKTAYNYLDISKEKYRVAAWIEEISRHESLFHSQFGRIFAHEKMENLMKDYLWTREAFFHNYIRQVVGLVSVQTLASGVLLGIGGYLVIERQLTIGQLVAAEIVISKVLSDMSKFGKHLEGFYSLVAAVDKVTSVLESESIEHKSNLFFPDDNEKKIEIRNIGYENSLGKKILENVNINLKRNKIIGFQSEQAYLKDTFFDILIGLISPSSGEIWMDGQNILKTDFYSHHNPILLLRRNEIVEGDIVENIRLGNNAISHIQVLRAFEDLGAEDFIHKLPDGIKTKVATFGSPLSQLERSLILLVRFLVHQPKIVMIDGLLDELPDSILKQFFDYSEKLKQKCTILIYSKSSSILSKMDEVIKINSSAGSFGEKIKPGSKRNV